MFRVSKILWALYLHDGDHKLNDFGSGMCTDAHETVIRIVLWLKLLCGRQVVRTSFQPFVRPKFYAGHRRELHVEKNSANIRQS